jgi:toxin YoeB
MKKETKTYQIEYSELFFEHIKGYRKSGYKSILVKINNLLDELRKHPYTGTGNPELLKYGRKGHWSRRITDKHRLIYEIHDTTVTVYIVSAFGHYDDK